eukprot:3427831-Pyramimonas_sp.AAC.1
MSRSTLPCRVFGRSFPVLWRARLRRPRALPLCWQTQVQRPRRGALDRNAPLHDDVVESARSRA